MSANPQNPSLHRLNRNHSDKGAIQSKQIGACNQLEPYLKWVLQRIDTLGLTIQTRPGVCHVASHLLVGQIPDGDGMSLPQCNQESSTTLWPSLHPLFTFSDLSRFTSLLLPIRYAHMAFDILQSA